MPAQVRSAPSRHPASESAPRAGDARDRDSTTRRSPTSAYQFIRDPGHRLGVAPRVRNSSPKRTWTGSAASRSASTQISAQRLQHELPGPNRGWIADQAGLSAEERPHEIRNELIAGPVAATDGISGASAGERDAVSVERWPAENTIRDRRWSRVRRSPSNSNTDLCRPSARSRDIPRPIRDSRSTCRS